MIIVKAHIPVKQQKRSEALALLYSLAEQSRREEGCLACDILQEPRTPNMLVVFQHWRSIDALEAHFASLHVESFIEALPELVDGDITSTRYEVLEMDDGVELSATVDLDVPEVLISSEVTIH